MLRSVLAAAVVGVLVLAEGDALGAQLEPGLAAAAAIEGSVPVLVQLAVPVAAEGWLSASERAVQRGAIANTQGAVLAQLGAAVQVRHRYASIPFFAARVDSQGLTLLERSPWVVSVQEDPLHHLGLNTSVPVVETSSLAALGFDGTQRTVVVIDTGVDGAHPNLADKIVGEACFSGNQDLPGNNGDCPNGNKSQVGPGAGVHCTFHDDCFHGTHVAGIAVGTAAPNYAGVAPGASLISIRVASLVTSALQCSPESAPCLRIWGSDEIAAFEEVYDNFRLTHSIAAVNMSIGGGVFSDFCDAQHPALKTVIENLRSVEIPSVISAGNDGAANGISAPACISSAVSVSATRDNDTIPSWANRASFLSLWAPGNGVRAPEYGTSGYITASGTSMAAPHVAGAWALLSQAVSGATVADVLAALQSTGAFITGATPNAKRIRIDAAYEQLTIDCSDGLDNDGDGLVDFVGGDPGCANASDASETDAALVCDDGDDNDSDGRTDFDPVTSASPGDETSAPAGEGDPGCKSPTWGFEEPQCQDGLDNDGDGKIDYDAGFFATGTADANGPDPQCVGSGASSPWPWRDTEGGGGGRCGLGSELVLLLPALAWLRTRRRASRS